MIGWLKSIVGKRKPARLTDRAFRLLRARFDAATTTPDNRRHWARYEVANNSYARGIVLTLANDVVGTAPRLQLLTTAAEANRRIEREFATWANAVSLAEKLRTLRMARAEDGEGFIVFTSNPALSTSIKLDLRLVEADQVTTPHLSILKSVVIGPARLNQKVGTAPRALEHGGRSQVRAKRRGRRVTRTTTIRARPFMGPAFEKEEPKLPAMWRDSIRP